VSPWRIEVHTAREWEYLANGEAHSGSGITQGSVAGLWNSVRIAACTADATRNCSGRTITLYEIERIAI